MTNVYTLTETGATINNEGINVILKKLEENNVPTDYVNIDGGKDMNDPKNLAKLLQNTKNPWIVISVPGELLYAPPIMKDEFIRLLSQADTGTSWEILTAAIKEHTHNN